MKHFIDLHAGGAEGLNALVDLALALKKSPPRDRPLLGKSVALCFMNPSLRTRVSFEVAAASLGCHPVTLSIGQDTYALEYKDGAVMDAAAAEHAREAVPVLSRLCDAIALRCFPEGKDWETDRRDPVLSAFVRHARVPVINLESALGHPCQALADLMTIREHMDPRGKRFVLAWAPHVKASPLAVPHSAAEMAALAGMHVTIARPEGYDLDPEVMARVASACSARGTRLAVTDRVEEAYADAQVVYAKSWGSLAHYGRPPSSAPAVRDQWRVTAARMASTRQALFMHCLPVRRNLKVDDAVLDGPSSVVIDQAENRLHTAKAVLLTLLRPEATCPT
ncbi:MAG: N-acetylornithine carbamoyltransferase [Elusimicrobia bacterium]|nr:N-acetylornithine carbamoyltransferase [Elusimicrobiota bacterium]